MPGSRNPGDRPAAGLLHRLRERGVLRVAASYAVILWLLLQIADVTLEPLGAPRWAMTALIVAAAVGLPIALALAWFLEVGADGVHVDTAPVGAARPQARGLRHYADAIVIGVLVIVVAVLLVRQSDLGKPKPPGNPAIAVLPFENLSGDPGQEYFAEGLAEETLDRLGRVPGLKVIARASSFGFKGQDIDAQTIAAKLSVTTLLAGSVRRDGQRLRLNARLIDGATGEQVWSGSFDREMTDVFAVQAELAGAIVDAIAPAAKGLTATIPSAPTTDLNAYDLYLAARSQLALRLPESIEKSVELMEQALRLDPGFARGQAHLASSLLFQAIWAAENDPASAEALRRRAESAIHKALALDPDLSEAHGAYANLLRDTEQPGADEQYQRALELNPNNAAAWHDYSVYLSNVADRRQESNLAMRRSLELDPRQPVTWANYLGVVANEGRARFEEEYARAIRTVGDMPGAMARFPFFAWAADRDGYRQQLEKALRLHLSQGQSPVNVLLPGALIPGFPAALLQAGVAARERDTQDNAPYWIYEYFAWQPVDLERARLSLPAAPGVRTDVDLASVRDFFEMEVAGLQGDWDRLDRLLGERKTPAGEVDALTLSVMAFWLAVQGRFEDASQSLARAGPIPAFRRPNVLGADRSRGLMETVMVRIYRKTGRRPEADRLAAEALRRMRPGQNDGDEACTWKIWEAGPVAYASLAAQEGLRDEAVRALRLAMRCGDLPFGFWPQLPWFRELEGYAPYDELLREREQRVARLRAELAALDPRGHAARQDAR